MAAPTEWTISWRHLLFVLSKLDQNHDTTPPQVFAY